jgi:putative flippase GtrA
MLRQALLVDRGELRRFALFLGVGLVNTGFGYAVFALLVLAGTGASVAAIGSTLIGALFNFRSIGLLVFGSREGRLLPRFLLVYALLCLANILALRVFAAANIGALAAEAAILPLLAIATFLLMRHFVFAPPSAGGLTS